MSESISLLVMAAGMGSRYGGLKQLDPVGPSGEVLLDYAVYDAKQAGISRVVFLIRKDLESDFRKAVGKRYEGKLEVDYAFQELHDLPKGFAVPEGRKKPWGTGQAILAAGKVIRGPFVAINADDFYGRESYQLLQKHLSEGRSRKWGICDGGIPAGSDAVGSRHRDAWGVPARRERIPGGRGGVF